MLTFNFSPFPILKTKRLILRELRFDEADALFGIRSNPEVLTYLDRNPETEIKQIESLIQNIKSAQNDNTGIFWAITLKDSDIQIGNITFWRTEPAHHRAEIGYTLLPEFQNKGIMSEAFAAVLNYGFETMHLHSVEANVNPLNAASIRLLEKHGFQKEAHFRENYYFNGKFLDSFIFCLLTPIK